MKPPLSDELRVRHVLDAIKEIENKFPAQRYVIVGHNDWRDKHSIEHTIELLTAYHGAGK